MSGIGWMERDTVLARLQADQAGLVRDIVNHEMFQRFWEDGRRPGILYDRQSDGLFDVQPVFRWDDAYEAERRGQS